MPLRLREVGSSAGLLLRWDRTATGPAAGPLGDPGSPLVFDGVWTQPGPDLSGPVEVLDRRGCDIAPIDATTADGRTTLLSFVWPDQLDRFTRLRTALEIAATTPVTIDPADAGAWVEEAVAVSHSGDRASVVFHSIVLQYLPEASRSRMFEALERAGESATADAPLAWLRMEPAGAVADLRLTTWPGGEEEVLATTGYHGQRYRAGATMGDAPRGGQRDTFGSPATNHRHGRSIAWVMPTLPLTPGRSGGGMPVVDDARPLAPHEVRSVVLGPDAQGLAQLGRPAGQVVSRRAGRATRSHHLQARDRGQRPQQDRLRLALLPA